MNKVTKLWVFPLVLFVVWPIYVEASGSGWELDCPIAVKAGSVLRVKVTIFNDDCFSPKTIDRVVKAVSGAVGGSLALVGPKVKTFSPPIVVPKASGCSTFPIIPGMITFKLGMRIPKTFANKAAMGFVGPIDDMGHAQGGFTCITEVVP